MMSHRIHHTAHPQPTPTKGYTVSVMGAGGGVLLASRHILSTAPTSKTAAIALAALQQAPRDLSPRVALRLIVGLALLIAVKELTKPVILAALGPFLPRPTPVVQKEEKGNGGNPEWDMGPAQALAKYLNYFTVGAAVVYAIPLLWATLRL